VSIYQDLYQIKIYMVHYHVCQHHVFSYLKRSRGTQEMHVLTSVC